jgi:hypothetical protein
MQRKGGKRMATANFRGNGYGLPTVAYIPRYSDEDVSEAMSEGISEAMLEDILRVEEQLDADEIEADLEAVDLPFNFELRSGYYEGFEIGIDPIEPLEPFYEDRALEDLTMADLEDLEYYTEFDLEAALDRRKRNYLEDGYSWELEARHYVTKAGWKAVRATLTGIEDALNLFLLDLIDRFPPLRVLSITARFSNGETWYGDATEDFRREVSA